MEDGIRITYEGKRYRVPYSAYKKFKSIILPDGRALKVGCWLESMPPQASEMVEIPHLFKNLDPKTIAESMDGVVAELI